MSAFRLLSLLFVLCLAACKPAAPAASAQTPTSAQDEENLAAVRAALLSPQQLPHFMWRQSLRLTTQGKTHNLQAVVQNDGKEFFVLGLGPGGIKLFLVSHTEQGVTSKVFVSQRLSLSPEYLLFDIQRALFWTLSPPCSRGEHRGFSVTDRCRNERTFRREVSDGPSGSAQSKTHLDISYPHGFTFKGPPDTLSLRHAARGYQIDIAQLESHVLP